MSVSWLQSWLDGLSLAEYLDTLAQHGYTSSKNLASIVERDQLRAIGVTKMGHLSRLFRAIEKLRSEGEGSEEVELVVSSSMENHGSVMLNSAAPGKLGMNEISLIALCWYGYITIHNCACFLYAELTVHAKDKHLVQKPSRGMVLYKPKALPQSLPASLSPLEQYCTTGVTGQSVPWDSKLCQYSTTDHMICRREKMGGDRAGEARGEGSVGLRKGTEE